MAFRFLCTLALSLQFFKKRWWRSSRLANKLRQLSHLMTLILPDSQDRTVGSKLLLKRSPVLLHSLMQIQLQALHLMMNLGSFCLPLRGLVDPSMNTYRRSRRPDFSELLSLTRLRVSLLVLFRLKYKLLNAFDNSFKNFETGHAPLTRGEKRTAMYHHTVNEELAVLNANAKTQGRHCIRDISLPECEWCHKIVNEYYVLKFCKELLELSSSQYSGKAKLGVSVLPRRTL